MTKGLQWITLIYFMLLTSLFDGANVGMTKEIDNLREGVICSIETEGEETPEEAITAGYTGAFWVEKDETVYLLETYDNLVLECRKDKIREIPLSQTVLPVNLVTDESRIYVYDEVLSELQIYSKQGELLVRSEISLQEDYVKGLKKTGEEIALLTFENRRLVVDSETGEFTEFTEEDVSVNIEGYDFTEYVSTDEDGTVYAVGTSLVKDCSIIAGELTLQAVSKEGNILGCYVMPVLEYSYLPLRYVHVMENGNIYLLVPTAEAVEVRKVALRESMESAMEEISAKAKELEENYAEDTKQRKWEGKAPTERVRITREKILERALAMAEYEWVLKPKNTRVDVSAPSVTLPKEIQKIIREKEGEASWSVTMTGIPYCWGGFFAIDGGTDGLRFQRMLDMGYIAGNVDSNGYYKFLTTGLDCSGFVTAALGLNTKLGTKGLADLGSARMDINSLEQMDFLVYPGEHVIFYGEWMEDASVLVLEATIKDGKVIVHPKNMNELVIDGKYQMRSPW